MLYVRKAIMCVELGVLSEVPTLFGVSMRVGATRDEVAFGYAALARVVAGSEK
jgi:hypothetical protein